MLNFQCTSTYSVKVLRAKNNNKKKKLHGTICHIPTINYSYYKFCTKWAHLPTETTFVFSLLAQCIGIFENSYSLWELLVLVKVSPSQAVCSPTRGIQKSEKERIFFSKNCTRTQQQFCKQTYSNCIVRLPQENWFCSSSMLGIAFWFIVFFLFGSTALFPA